MTTTKLLALSLLAACATEADLTTAEQGVDGRPILLPESGTGQNRVVMNAFAPLVVNLTDIDGAPLSNVQITFTAPAAGASAVFAGGNHVTTDANGRAQITPWASSLKGTYTVWANADGADPMPFTLTNIPDAPAILVQVLGSGQVRQLRMPFNDPLVVAVWDRYGNAIEGAEVAFEAPATGPTTQMPAGGNTITDDEGHASVFAVAGDQPGSYTVSAKVTGAPRVGFTLTNAAPGNVITLPNGAHVDLDVAFEQAP